MKDPWRNFRRGATGTARINRKDFGLTWNRALETGGVLVGEDIDIFVEIELIKKVEPPRAKARGSSTRFVGAEPSEAYPTTLVRAS